MRLARASFRIGFWLLVAGVVVYALAPARDAGLTAVTDKGRHFLAFAVMAAGGAATGALPRSIRAVVFWTALAIGIEVAQGVMELGRDASVFDAAASFMGAMFGLFVAPKSDDISIRDGVLAASLILMGTLGVDIAWRLGRPAVSHTLLQHAWQSQSAAPWPGAPGNVYARVTLPGAPDITIIDRASVTALALAPGLWTDGDARRPGEPGTTILLGHRNGDFRALGTLPVGADVALHLRDGGRFDYVVTRRDIVRFDDSHLQPEMPGEQIALVTCWPVDAVDRSDLRLVVYAERRAPTHAVLSR